VPTPSLATTIAGVRLRSPVILAAGTAGTLDELADVLDLSRVGAVVTKSITPLPREGNRPWRVVPLRAGMLNAVGLANVGIDAFVRDHAPRIASIPAPVIGSVAGFSVDDYVRVAGAMDAVDALAAIELNVSCPNVHRGCEFASDPALLGELIRAVRDAVRRKPLFVKLSPIPTGRTTMTDIARAAADPGGPQTGGPGSRPGADAVCIANTTPAMAIDPETRRPRLGRVAGGLSGPAVHAMAVKLVFDVYRNFARDAGLPIVGVGGVLTWQDAAEFILAGAGAVQVGTALFADPRAPIRIAGGLASWVKRQRALSITDLIGKVDLSQSQER